MKDFFLHKITLRVCYIASAYVTSHLVALFASTHTQAILTNSGVVITIVDPQKLETYLTGILLIVGEFVYRFAHTKLILPHVTAKTN